MLRQLGVHFGDGGLLLQLPRAASRFGLEALASHFRNSPAVIRSSPSARKQGREAGNGALLAIEVVIS